MKTMNRNLFIKLSILATLLFVNPFMGCAPKKQLAGKDNQWFQIAVLPDTQYYTALRHGGKMEMFEQQIEWIKKNYKDEQIAYVAHVGDISDHGEQFMTEWERARTVMYRLEEPLPGLPHGIPYGVAVGNHDTTPNGTPKLLTKGYAQSFGRDHFLGRTYYGGAFRNRSENDNHFDVFKAAGQDFLVLYIAYNEPSHKAFDEQYQKEVFGWASEVLNKYKDHKTIIVSHSILKRPAKSSSAFIPGQGTDSIQSKFTSQGSALYQHFKHHSNVFMMLCGHVSGEGYRVETFNGNTIKIYLADYQSRRNYPYGETDRNGGDGYMRLMKINPVNETLEVRTIAPRKDGNHVWEEDADSKFVHVLYK